METTNTSNTQQAESKWYVLRVVSGKEKKVKEYLDKEISRSGWDKVVKQVFLPVEKVYKVQNGKKLWGRVFIKNERKSVILYLARAFSHMIIILHAPQK